MKVLFFKIKNFFIKSFKKSNLSRFLLLLLVALSLYNFYALIHIIDLMGDRGDLLVLQAKTDILTSRQQDEQIFLIKDFIRRECGKEFVFSDEKRRYIKESKMSCPLDLEKEMRRSVYEL